MSEKPSNSCHVWEEREKKRLSAPKAQIAKISRNYYLEISIVLCGVFLLNDHSCAVINTL